MTYASRTVTPAGPFPAEVDLALAGIRSRLSWPSMHWDVRAHVDAWPHIAAAALDSAGPLIVAKAAARALFDAADTVANECSEFKPVIGGCDDCEAQATFLEQRATKILETAGLIRADLQDVTEPSPTR